MSAVPVDCMPCMSCALSPESRKLTLHLPLSLSLSLPAAAADRPAADPHRGESPLSARLACRHCHRAQAARGQSQAQHVQLRRAALAAQVRARGVCRPAL